MAIEFSSVSALSFFEVVYGETSLLKTHRFRLKSSWEFSVERRCVHSNLLSRPFRLLHIDDSPDDRTLLAEAIRRTDTPFELHSADGPQSARPYFEPHLESKGTNAYPRPQLVLLDYEMGELTGADFLCWLRVEKKITSVPVVMYSGSVGMNHVTKCYASGANHFLCKAQTFESLQKIVCTLHLCMSFFPLRFGPLTRLREYECNPTAGVFLPEFPRDQWRNAEHRMNS